MKQFLLKCNFCDKNFTAKTHNKIFCSEECKYNHLKAIHPTNGICPICQKEIPKTKIRNQFCSRSCANTYINNNLTSEQLKNKKERLILRNKSLTQDQKEKYHKKAAETRANWTEEKRKEMKEKYSSSSKSFWNSLTNEERDELNKKRTAKSIKTHKEKRKDSDWYEEYCKKVKEGKHSKLKDRFGEEKYNQYIDPEFNRNMFFKDGTILYEEWQNYYKISRSQVQALAKEYYIVDKNLKKFKNPGTSIEEMYLFDFLSEKYPNFLFEKHNRDIIKNPDTNRPLEIDIIIKNFEDNSIIAAVEYNGGYYHNKTNTKKEELKTELCENKNIKLFHIWYDSYSEDVNSLIDYLNSL